MQLSHESNTPSLSLPGKKPTNKTTKSYNSHRHPRRGNANAASRSPLVLTCHADDPHTTARTGLPSTATATPTPSPTPSPNASTTASAPLTLTRCGCETDWVAGGSLSACSCVTGRRSRLAGAGSAARRRRPANPRCRAQQRCRPKQQHRCAGPFVAVQQTAPQQTLHTPRPTD